jgi:hypothetical protein
LQAKSTSGYPLEIAESLFDQLKRPFNAFRTLDREFAERLDRILIGFRSVQKFRIGNAGALTGGASELLPRLEFALFGKYRPLCSLEACLLFAACAAIQNEKHKKKQSQKAA